MDMIRISHEQDVTIVTPQVRRIDSAVAPAFKEAVLKLEKKIIVKVLERHQWNRKKAARALNIWRPNGHLLFHTWLYRIYEDVPYDLATLKPAKG